MTVLIALIWLDTHSAIVMCWDTAAHAFAAGMTVLLVLMTGILLQAGVRRAVQQAELARDHIMAAEAHAGPGRPWRAPMPRPRSADLRRSNGTHATQQGLLDMARQPGDTLLALINEILETSRMEACHLTLRPSTFALRPPIESALEMFCTQAAESRIALRQ